MLKLPFRFGSCGWSGRVRGVVCGLALPGTAALVLGAPLARADVALCGESAIELARTSSGDALWTTPAELQRLSGFQLKPQGLCLEQICVPVQRESDGALVRGEGAELELNAAELARRLGQPYALDEEQRVWSFAPVPVAERAFLERAQAPDFELPDRSGRLVRLSSLRGKKVLIVTWASWCRCREDLVQWQELYRELGGPGFELIAVAEDSDGEAAAGPYLDAAQPTYTTLIDRTHLVTARFHLVNVPTAIWIDEQGTVVRLDQGAYPQRRRILGVAVGAEGYADGLRDWIARGNESPFARPVDDVSKHLARRSSDEALADQHFRIGAYFHARGDAARARRHWERAASLAPDNWNYARQEWSDSGFESTVKFLGKALGRTLRGVPYYAPIEMPGQTPAPAPAEPAPSKPSN